MNTDRSKFLAAKMWLGMGYPEMYAGGGVGGGGAAPEHFLGGEGGDLHHNGHHSQGMFSEYNPPIMNDIFHYQQQQQHHHQLLNLPNQQQHLTNGVHRGRADPSSTPNGLLMNGIGRETPHHGNRGGRRADKRSNSYRSNGGGGSGKPVTGKNGTGDKQ